MASFRFLSQNYPMGVFDDGLPAPDPYGIRCANVDLISW